MDTKILEGCVLNMKTQTHVQRDEVHTHTYYMEEMK